MSDLREECYDVFVEAFTAEGIDQWNVRGGIGAVLAYLTERGVLVPELPEGWLLFEAEVRTPGEVAVLIQAPPWVDPEEGSPDDEPTEYVGNGPTLAAAIANALKEGE